MDSSQVWIDRTAWICVVLSVGVFLAFTALNVAFGFGGDPAEVVGAHAGIVYVPFLAAILGSSLVGAILGWKGQRIAALVVNAVVALAAVGYYAVGYWLVFIR